MKAQKAAVFLDRDGVLIEDSPNYITRVDQVILLPGVAEATRKLTDAGFTVVVVTNQAAVARGLVTEEGVETIHAHLQQLLAQAAGARIDKIYYCPFHPEGTVRRYARASDRRKPAPGMLLDAARDLGIRLYRSYLVGDKESDMIAAKEVSCKAIAVLTGPDATNVANWDVGRPDFVAADLPEAVDWILRKNRS
jgi:D-glycero-D-manno-heptose 1,7-bisphosphate phosphatase